jgi:nitroreductase
MPTVFDLIKTKRSTRHFTDQPIPDEIVREILNAGRLSGSSKNTQPWHFVAVTKRETLIALSQCGEFAGHMAGATLGIVLVGPDPKMRSSDYDLGQAAQNMMLSAWSHGIGSVMASIYEAEQAARILNLPESGYRIDWAISFGYPAKEVGAPRKSGRRLFEEVAHFEGW